MNDEDNIYLALQSACKMVLKKEDVTHPKQVEARFNPSMPSSSKVYEFRGTNNSPKFHNPGSERAIDKHFLIKPLIEINKPDCAEKIVLAENELHQIDSMINRMNKMIPQVCSDETCKHCRSAAEEIPTKLNLLHAIRNAVSIRGHTESNQRINT